MFPDGQTGAGDSTPTGQFDGAGAGADDAGRAPVGGGTGTGDSERAPVDSGTTESSDEQTTREDQTARAL